MSSKEIDDGIWFFNQLRLRIYKGVIIETSTQDKIDVYKIRYINDLGLEDIHETIESFIGNSYQEARQKAMDIIKNKIDDKKRELSRLENKLEELKNE